MKVMRRISIGVLTIIMMLGMSTAAFGASSIGESEALDIALNNAGLSKAKVKNIEVEKEKNHYDVEFDKKSNGAEYDYEIAAKDGRIWEKTVEYKYKKNQSKKKIGKEKARKKVAEFSGKSYNVVKKGSCKYIYKNNQGKYEVKFRDGSSKYEYELQAPNGKIIEYEYEYTGTR